MLSFFTKKFLILKGVINHAKSAQPHFMAILFISNMQFANVSSFEAVLPNVLLLHWIRWYLELIITYLYFTQTGFFQFYNKIGDMEDIQWLKERTWNYTFRGKFVFHRMATFSSPRTFIHLHELSLFRIFDTKCWLMVFLFFFFSFANTFLRIRGEIYLSILITLITDIALNITCHIYDIDSNLIISCKIKF